jgi:hypothetical protein
MTGSKMEQELKSVVQLAKKAAIEYYKLTKKPLGITGEIGELIAASELDLELAKPRTIGYDAEKEGIRYQIKTRANHKKTKSFYNQRTSKINIEADWDKLVLVLLDDNYELTELAVFDKEKITKELQKPGSRARSEKNTLSIRELKNIGQIT